MSTTNVAKHARPPHVAIAWATKDAIFCEIPMTGGGPPYVVKYPKSASGLARAFGVLGMYEAQSTPIEGRDTDHPKVVRKTKHVNGTAPSSTAMELVRQMRVK